MKVLAISSNCFSRTNSNGRILGCLFREFDREDVAELYVTDGVKDYSICSYYYQYSDKDALLSIFPIRKRKAKENKDENTEKVSTFRKKFGRSALMMICRELIWYIGKWWNNDLRNWLDQINPDVVVLQCGDIPFFYRIATKISLDRRIPLVLFNTEISYFIENSGDNRIVFRLYQCILRKAMKKALNIASLSIYNSQWLKDKFDSEFHKPSIVIYQSSDLELQKPQKRNSIFHIVYTGNISWGRCYPLSDIAKALLKINNEYKLDVYGVVEDQETMDVLNNTPGLIYHGIVPYQEVTELIAKASVLIITENSDEKYSRLTNFGFSGKITDSLFSGIPILAYGPKSNVGLKYLKDNDACLFVSKKNDLEDALREILFNEEKRTNCVTNAQKIAVTNHDAQKNSTRFKELLNEVARNHDKVNVYHQ